MKNTNPLEKEIEKKVTDYAKRKGILSYKFVSPANRSVPDRYYVYKGHTFFIEFKRAGKLPTDLQAATILKMLGHGSKVYVVDSIGQGKECIDLIIDDYEFYNLLQIIWNDDVLVRQAQYTTLASIKKLAMNDGHLERLEVVEFLLNILAAKDTA